MNDLRAAGFADSDISLVMQQRGAAPERGAGETKANEGTVAGASIGAVLGGVAGLGALAIPGIGPLLAAGPIAAALGALTGGALGGLVARSAVWASPPSMPNRMMPRFAPAASSWRFGYPTVQPQNTPVGCWIGIVPATGRATPRRSKE